MAIDILRQEHRNIEKLLVVLERELAVFARGDRPDYEVSMRLSPISRSIPIPATIRWRT
jgi:hemerythrin-like domain-containing protein